MIHIAKFIARHLVLTAFLGLVAVALLLSAARAFTPLILERYAEDFANSASARLGQPVTVGSLSARWRGVGPVLVLHDVQLWEPDRSRSVLDLQEIIVDFALGDMLSSGFLAPGRVNLSGLHLTVIRQPDGNVTIEGITPAGGSRGGDATALLLAPARLRLRQSRVTIEDRMRQRPPLVLEDVEVDIRNDESRHQLDADAILSGGRIRLRADMHGELGRPLNEWRGETYARSRELSLSNLLRPELPPDYQLVTGTGQFEVWADWSNGQMQTLSGTVGISDLRLDGLSGRSVSIDRVGGDFGWRREPRGWELEIARLQLERGQRAWPEGRLRVAHRLRGTTAEQLRFQSDFLDLSDVMAVLTIRPPEDGLLADLVEARPEGRLEDIRLISRPNAGAAYSFSAGFDDLGASASGHIPAIRNLSGHLHATANGGRLTLHSEDLTIHPVKLFRWPIPVERLDGEVAWMRNGKGWRIETPALDLVTPHISTVSRLRLDLPETGSPLVDIQTDFRDAVGTYAPLYYPANIMKPGLLGWMERSIIDARVPWGSFILRGPIAEFPFHETHSGHFEVVFGVEDGLLDYLPEWPPLEDLVADIRFHNNSMSITGGEARILSSQLRGMEARLGALRRPGSPLELRGEASGPLADVLAVLGDTPLREKFGRVVEGAEATGRSRLSLDMLLPLKTRVEGALAGQLEFLEAGLRKPEWGVDFSAISGTLDVTDNGLDAKDVNATVANRPVRVSVQSSAAGTRVGIRGRLSAAAVKQQYPALGMVPMEGTSYWNIQVQVPPTDRLDSKPLEISAASTLEGTAVNLPLQLGKPAEGEMPFRAEVELAGGTVGQISVDLGPLSLKGAAMEDGWQGRLESPTASGQLFLPSAGTAGAPVRADFDRLSLTVDPASHAGQPPSPTRKTAPRDIPELVITSRDTLINSHPYGELAATLRHIEGGVRLEQLSLESEQGELQVTGEWTSDEDGQATALEIDIRTTELGRTLKDLALSGAVAEGTGAMSATIAWQGPPYAWEKETLKGELRIQAEKGRFEETEPGVARLFGLLNVAALQRRLRLDFTDLFREGFAFEEIAGTFFIENGLARTDDTHIDSPSGKIRIEGTTNLVTRVLDQDIAVIPAISGAVALAGTLTGGPVVGAALLAAGKGIDKLATVRYRMTGPWDAPEIVRLPLVGKGESPEDQGMPEIH
jgi:uncharacterized protein (TIGR02099 family)